MDFFSSYRKRLCMTCKYDNCPMKSIPKCQLQAILSRHLMVCPNDIWLPEKKESIP